MAIETAARVMMASVEGAPLVLASGSRFRRHMLASAGVGVQVVIPAVDEPAARARMVRDTPAITPSQIAVRLAVLKALEVSQARPQSLIIAADQVLVLDGAIYAKPSDVATARQHIRALRGRAHCLPTAVVLARGGQIVWEHLETPVLTMRAFSDVSLEAYLTAAGQTVTETVGGYALEGLGGQLFERVEGDYFSIIGLPLLALLAALRRHGVLLD